MPHHKELRVHGVSGTPPRDMLLTDPVTMDPTREHTRVFRRRPADITFDTDGGSHEFEAKAFHWGSLTTGHWLTAFWILLGPFAFANVAGWMVRKPSRFTHLAVRLAGMGMTALFVAQLGFVFIEVPSAYFTASQPRAAMAVGALLFTLVYGGIVVMWLSTQTHFEENFPWPKRLRLTLSPKPTDLLPPKFWESPRVAEELGQWKDPAGSPITAPELWAEHAILHRIRSIHFALGLAVIGVLVGARGDLPALMWVAVGLAGVFVLLMAATTVAPENRAVQALTGIAPIVTFVLALAGISIVGFGTGPLASEPTVHEITFYIAMVLGVFSALTLVGGWVTAGAMIIAILFGSSLGTGLGLIVEGLAGTEALTDLTHSGAAWSAVGMLFLVLTIAITAVLLSLLGPKPPRQGKAMAALRNTTVFAPWIFRVAAIFGIIAGIGAFGLGCLPDGCDPTKLGLPEPGGPMYVLAIGVMSLLVVLVAARAWVFSPWIALVIVAVGGAAVYGFANEALPVRTVAGVTINFNDLVEIAKGLIVLLPVGLILRSMIGSIKRGTSNRQVGILWDVASLWPRWFHPLAPPAYGPKVITALKNELIIDPPEILEAHSQGSVIAAVTLTQLDEVEPPTLLTYGSPLGLLYLPLFPGTGIKDMVSSLKGRLDGRWRNLWRDTDPLGGLPIGLGEGDVQAVDSTGHSWYEETSAFREARHRLLQRDSSLSDP